MEKGKGIRKVVANWQEKREEDSIGPNGERRRRWDGKRGCRRFVATILHLVQPLLAPSFPFTPPRGGRGPAAHPPPPPSLPSSESHQSVSAGRSVSATIGGGIHRQPIRPLFHLPAVSSAVATRPDATLAPTAAIPSG